MDRLYEKVAEELVGTVKRYMDNKTDLEDVLLAQERMLLLWECKNWALMKRRLKNSIFELSLELFNKIGDCEKLVKTFEKMNASKVIDCDVEGLLASSMLIGRNSIPPAGFGQSAWYVSPFPTIQMIEALKEEPEPSLQNH